MRYSTHCPAANSEGDRAGLPHTPEANPHRAELRPGWGWRKGGWLSPSPVPAPLSAPPPGLHRLPTKTLRAAGGVGAAALFVIYKLIQVQYG